ncbi:UNVERIFIED_CONTAM: hypothetical protein FKN15_037940 [Acipenser sinensis]
MPVANTMTAGRAVLVRRNFENCNSQSIDRLQFCGVKRGEILAAIVLDSGLQLEGETKTPLTSLDNLTDAQGRTTMLTQKHTGADHQASENGLTGSNRFAKKLPANKLGLKSKASIRDKISQWEGKKEVPSPLLTRKEPETAKKEAIKTSEVRRGNSKRFVGCEKEDPGKENSGKTRDLTSNTPQAPVNRECKLEKGISEELCANVRDNKSVLTRIKKLEQALKEGPSQPQLVMPGNYFCPAKEYEAKGWERRPTEPIFGTLEVVRPGSRTSDQENVYTEPGAPSINPLPKPQRTFQHDGLGSPSSTAPGLGRGRRNLPPLPSIPPPPLPTCPPPSISRRAWADKHRNNANSECFYWMRHSGAPAKTILKVMKGIEHMCLSVHLYDGNFIIAASELQRRRTTQLWAAYRKSYEFEDVLQSSTEGCQVDWNAQSKLSLTRTLSEENVYEDIRDPPSKENPYEDIETESRCVGNKCILPRSPPLSAPGTPTKLPSKPSFFRQNSERRSFKLLDLRKTNREGACSPSKVSPPSTPSSPDDTPCLSGDPNNRRRRKIPKLVLKINGIYEARWGKKRMKRVSQSTESSSGKVTDENSESESDTEEKLKAHSQRLVHVQSMLKQTGCYRTQERDLQDLLNLQERKLFEYFLVVALHKKQAGLPYLPEVTQQFPLKLERGFKFMRETEDQLKVIPQFCFPDARDWEPVQNFARFETSASSITSQILDEVEKRRAISPALVQPFMRSIMEAPFPAPGRTITVKNFLPGSGTEVIMLCRPLDSRLEHVDFECLFSSLNVRLLVRVFASLLLERRVIFTADKLSTLSQCCHAVVAMLYPFAWQHTYIPVLPPSMIDIVCTPTPFIVGLLSSSLPQLKELPIEEVLVVDLCNNRFLRQMDDEDSILPHKLQAALEHVLEKRKELACEKGEPSLNDSSSLSVVVSEAIVRFFVEMVGHYSLFLGPGEREDEGAVFHRDAFRKAISSKSLRRFLEVFMETQMFAGFIHDQDLRRQGLRGLFELRAQDYLDSLPGSEQSGVNKFLKGLGSMITRVAMKCQAGVGVLQCFLDDRRVKPGWKVDTAVTGTVSSHIQVLARRKAREIQVKLKDQAAKDKALQSMATMSSAQILSANTFQSKLALQALPRPAYPAATGGRSIGSSKFRMLEFSVFLEQQRDPDTYNKHLFVHIGQSNPTFSDPYLEAVDIRQIYDKFPEKKGGLKDLFEKGPVNAFFLVKFWADLNTNMQDDSGSFYGVSSQYDSSENMIITCSTNVCSFGKQVVEKVETEYAQFENGHYVFRIHRSPLCEYMINFIHKLKHLPEKYMMNSVLENFTILQLLKEKSSCLLKKRETVEQNMNLGHSRCVSEDGDTIERLLVLANVTVRLAKLNKGGQ